jgi:hypothetical protein
LWSVAPAAQTSRTKMAKAMQMRPLAKATSRILVYEYTSIQFGYLRTASAANLPVP